MGSARYSADAWASSATVMRARAAGSTARSTTAATIDAKMTPKTITFREARDSVPNPKSLPIILALDCTGSMSDVIHSSIKKFEMIIEELVDKKAVEDPAIMTMFFDDVIFVGDRALQVSQFESDEKIAEQLGAMHIVGNGGGNSSESYHLPLYMAAFKTRTDAHDKRGKKGYLFTVGDEEMPPPLTPDQIKTVFGPDESVSQSLSYMDLFEAASRMYHVFHVVVMEGGHARGAGEKRMREAWRDVGQSLIILDDLDKLPEVVVSTIRIVEGEDAAAVAKSWSGTTAVTVAKATGHLAKKSSGGDTSAGVVTL